MTEKAPGLEATAKTIKLRVGEVAKIGVKAPAGVRPAMNAPDGPPLFVARNASGEWVGAWVPTQAGKHEINVGAEGHDSVTVTVDAAAREDS